MNLLFVVLDCLRLDHWQEHMPRAQTVTRNWFHFDNHWGVAHCSDPNHAALFTGCGPWQTLVTTQMGAKYTDKLPTLFWRWKHERLGRTLALMPLMVPAFYRAHVDDMAWHKGTDSADLELRAVKSYLDDGDRFCLFIRDMTCHYPYLDLDMPPRGEAGEIRPQYGRAVEHVDEFVSRLIELVLEKYPNTVCVICSDHGELLGEHGEYDHLYTLYNYLVRTPMAVYIPGLMGKRTDRSTQHIDLWPTLCDALGIERQGEGYSWHLWMTGESDNPVPANRSLLLQGTGAGPVSEEHLRSKGNRAIDPGFGRVLWRHRGYVKGSWKLTEDVHADGLKHTKLTKTNDYSESHDYAQNRKHIVHRMTNKLPPLPDYHEWENDIIRQRYEAMIMDRLTALGYA